MAPKKLTWEIQEASEERKQYVEIDLSEFRSFSSCTYFRFDAVEIRFHPCV